MTDAPHAKRNRLVVDLPEDDRAWVRAQSEATGWHSEALVVRMLIKDAREKGLGFAVVAQAPHVPQQRSLSVVPTFRPAARQHLVAVADVDEPPPAIEPEEVEQLLAERLGEKGIDAAALATEPWPEMAAPPEMVGMALAVRDGVAVSLAPAPPRAARDYR